MKFGSVLLLVVLCIALFVYPCFAQTADQARPKLKDFGSSLKRLRWNSQTRRAVEVNQLSKASTSSDTDDVVRIETDLVSSNLLVVDAKGKLVENLTANDFLIIEDGQPQRVEHFSRGDSASIGRSIVLIIDYSGSLIPYLRRSIDAAKMIVDKLRPLDLMAVVTDDVELLIDFTNDKKQLKKKLESLYERTQEAEGFLQRSRPSARFGKSAQYSALTATLKEAFRQEDLLPIIIFQTDGDELYFLRDPILTHQPPPDLPDDLKAQSMKYIQQAMKVELKRPVQFSLEDVYRTVEKSRATIYTVIPGFQVLNRTQDEQLALMKTNVEAVQARISQGMNDEARKKFLNNLERWRESSPANLLAKVHDMEVMQKALVEVASRAGGWTEFLESAEQADEIYNKILADMNRRYLIGYYPTNKAHDGTRRRIKFEVKSHPEYQILGRNSYVAPLGP